MRRSYIYMLLEFVVLPQSPERLQQKIQQLMVNRGADNICIFYYLLYDSDKNKFLF